MSVFAPTSPPTDLLGIPVSLPQLVGNTPLIRLKGIEEDFQLSSPLYAKLELMNPGGSVKDRIGVYMVQDALARGGPQETHRSHRTHLGKHRGGPCHSPRGAWEPPHHSHAR